MVHVEIAIAKSEPKIQYNVSNICHFKQQMFWLVCVFMMNSAWYSYSSYYYIFRYYFRGIHVGGSEFSLFIPIEENLCSVYLLKRWLQSINKLLECFENFVMIACVSHKLCPQISVGKHDWPLKVICPQTHM